ncbi:MAG: helix-turn-helix domain-containing protein [Acidobacteriota bacterium]
MKDPDLRSCSVAARGLWMDMLCLMFECDRRGYLQAKNGKPFTHEQLARMTGCSSEEVSRLLQELETSGVFSRTRDGVIFSRRQVRDEEQRADHRARQDKYRKSQKSKKNGDADMTEDMTPLSHLSSSSASAINTPPLASEGTGQPMPRSPGAGGEFAAAFWLQQEIGLACTAGDMQVLAQCVGFVARDLSFAEAAEAAEWLKRAAEAASRRGEVVNLFWFKDGKYKGVQSGANQSSPAKQRINGARRKLAEIAVKRGIVDLAGGDGRDDEEIPIAGPRGVDRGIPGRSRSLGGEVLSPDGRGGIA